MNSCVFVQQVVEKTPKISKIDGERIWEPFLQNFYLKLQLNLASELPAHQIEKAISAVPCTPPKQALSEWDGNFTYPFEFYFTQARALIGACNNNRMSPRGRAHRLAQRTPN